MLLLLPYRDNSVARKLPLVTIVLTLACALLLFAFQGRDAQIERYAFEFYSQSGLAAIELPRYQDYLAARSDPESAERLHLLQHAPAASPVGAALLQADARFRAELHAHHIVRADDPQFVQWNTARARFEQMLGATLHARFSLGRETLDEPWRFVSYAFVHASLGHLLGNLLVLALVGPFVEAALGSARFALGYLAGAAAAGALHLLVSDASVIGASGAIAASVGMLAVLYGTRRVPVFYWIVFVFGTARIPALVLLPVWLANEGYQWSLQDRGPLGGAGVAYGAHIGGLCAGALLAWILRPAGSVAAHARSGSAAPGTVRGSTLALQAQEAASRLDIRRATRLYRVLLEQQPDRVDHLSAYLNVTILGADDEAMQDAALRLLWTKFRTPTDELRKSFLQLAQPKVLKALPIDEHLRLARRLVRLREDAAALRVIDDILRDNHLRELYGRQLADCLLGLYTTYVRNRLTRQAEAVQTRLSSYFPSTETLGGIAPSHRPPSTLITSLRPTVAGLSLEPPHTRGPPPTRGGRTRG